jgi:pyruvate kinase
MSSQTSARPLRRLIAALDQLLQEVLDFELHYAAELEQVDRAYLDSARNLLHYLGVRRHDIRKLQESLSALGLSSLGRMEAHTLATLKAVLDALHHMAGLMPPELPEREPPVNFRAGPALLADHANALLGPAPTRRVSRVMVTMPSAAADDPQLIRELLGAGMNLMRINCAHDGPAAWLAMIAHLRQAERELGVHCRVLADLAGPKLRTGPIEGAEPVMKIRPRRDVRGRVLDPARVWFTPLDAVEPAPECATASVPVSAALLEDAAEGDRLVCHDTRGRRRVFRVRQRIASSVLAECERTSYLASGTLLRLRRGGRTRAHGVVGSLPEVAPALLLRPGDRLRVTGADTIGRPPMLDAAGNAIEPASIPCTLDPVLSRVQRGEQIWFDDGRIGGRVVAVEGSGFVVEIDHARPGGTRLRTDKGINLPDTEFDLPALTAKDYLDLAAVAAHVDMVGLSFVRRPEDVELLVEHLAEIGATQLGIVLKIENRRAFEHLPRILLTALRSPPVGIMVARGDLAVEMGFERLAEVQEEILWMCEAAHVPVIWATQVLEGLAKTGAPSRAEVTDAAMSARAECVMLNKGPYIVEATRFLGAVLERMQAHQSKKSATLRSLAVSQMR